MVTARAPERPAVGAAPREQTRARYPDTTGFIERDGVRVFYEVYGSGEPTLLLLPTWSIIHSRFWKMQIPYLARRYRVITFDGRGNGRSDRPKTAEAYAAPEFAADAVAVMDATMTSRAVVLGLSMGAARTLLLASDHPERVAGAVFIGPSLDLDPPTHGDRDTFMDHLDTDEGWNKYNAQYWRRDYQGFLEFFFGKCLTEPHSTKPIEDTVGWGLETDPETLILTHIAPEIGGRDDILARSRRVTCPVLVIHGREDAISPHRHAEELARESGGQLITIEGGGHIPNARDPVKVNLAIRDFIESIPR
jgi:pimeloyl-ACP methyl ester carboxylesterase